MRPRFPCGFLAAAIVLVSTCVLAGEFYTWRDERGEIHFSDSLSNVPPKYLDQIEGRRFEERQPDEAGTAAEKTSRERPVNQAGPQAASGRKKAKRHEIPYTAREGTAKRVIVSAVLNGTVSAPLAIDTGAPGTVISASLANKLGLFDDDHGKVLIRARGIGGSAPAVRTVIDTVEVGGARNTFIPTTVTAKLSDAFEGLLGMDFVANFAVTIDSSRKTVVFEELPENPEHPGGHDQEWWTTLFREFSAYRTQWKDYGEQLDKKIRNSLISSPTKDKELKEFADAQFREADKLYDKLEQYAAQNSVPMHWRRY